MSSLSGRPRVERPHERLMRILKRDPESATSQCHEGPEMKVLKKNHQSIMDAFQRTFGSTEGITMTYATCPVCKKRIKSRNNGSASNLVSHFRTVHLGKPISEDSKQKLISLIVSLKEKSK